MNGLLLAALLISPGQVVTAEVPAESSVVDRGTVQQCGLFGRSRQRRPQTRQPQRPAARPAQRPAQRPAPQAAPMIPANDAVRAAERLTRSIVHPDIAWTNCGYTLDGALQRSFSKASAMPADVRAEFTRQLTKQFRETGGVLATFAKAAADDRMEILGAGERDGRRIVYVRLVNDELDACYHELLAVRRGRTVIFEDIYSTALGQWFSDLTAAHITSHLTDAIHPATRAAARKLNRRNTDLARIRKAVARDERTVGEEILAEQSEEFRASFEGRLLEFGLAMNRHLNKIDTAEELKVEADLLAAEFPNELEAIDCQLVAASFVGDAECIIDANARATKLTGPDAYRFSRDGTALLRMGRTDEALTLFEKTIEAEPNDATPTLLACHALMAEGYSELALKRLKLADRRFSIRWQNLGDFLSPESFAETPEYQTFMKYLGDRAPEAPTQVAQPDEGTFRL